MTRLTALGRQILLTDDERAALTTIADYYKRAAGILDEAVATVEAAAKTAALPMLVYLAFASRCADLKAEIQAHETKIRLSLSVDFAAILDDMSKAAKSQFN